MGVPRIASSVPAVLLAVSVTVATAWAAAAPARPVTALVLSGGGARGGAHVGVLRVLDEERVPVDLVVGTSMGAVVGGLWSSGLSPDELQRALTEADWRELLTDRPPRQDLSFRRKQDDAKPLFRFELGVGRKGFVLPSGLIAGHKLGSLLRRMTIDVSGVEHFDALPVRFRAVATDLSTGGAVVLERGDLADVMRASMSVPGVFTPVEIDGRTLVDGGLVANLPVSFARELGAERIIAVDVTKPLEEYDAARSVLGVASQTLDLVTDSNVRAQRALLSERDLLVRPRLDEVGSTGFREIGTAIVRGEEAARAAADRLREFAVSETAYAEFVAGLRDPAAPERTPVRIDRIEIVGTSRVDPRIVRRRLETRAGELLETDSVLSDVDRIYRIGDFERVDFTLQRLPGENLLAFEAREKGRGPNFLRFGMELEADFKGTSDFTVLAEFTRTQLNRLGAEWKTTGTAGDVDSLVSEFFQPFGYSGFGFVAPLIEIFRTREEALDDVGAVEVTRDRRLQAGVDFGVQLRNWGEIRVGLRNGTLNSDLRTGAGLQKSRFDIGGIRFQGILDQLDNTSFPRRGAFGRLTAFVSRDGLNADDEYDRLDFSWTQAGSVGPHTLVGKLRYGSSLGSDLPDYADFYLGGFLNLSGLRPRELRGDALGYVHLAYYHRLLQLPGGIGSCVYVGLAIEAGNVWEDEDAARLSDLRPAGVVFGGVDTFLGPVYLGYGLADSGDHSFYLFLGRAFF